MQQHLFSLPHARGGVSHKAKPNPEVMESSPRPWGCFWSVCEKLSGQLVFPTPVGVFLNIIVRIFRQNRLPHARGGVS